MKKNHNNTQDLIALGKTYMSRNCVKEAIEVFDQASRISPKSVSAWVNLGKAYMRYGKIDAAHACFFKAIALDGQSAVAVFDCAGALAALGELEQALGYYEKAIVLDEGLRVSAIAGIADALEKLGRVEESFKRLEPFLTCGQVPAEIAEVLSQLVLNHERYSAYQDKVVDLLEAFVHSADAGSSFLVRAHFKLGRLYRKQHDYCRSFAAFHKAHELVGLEYNLDELERNIGKLKGVFAAADLAGEPADKYRNIFILGLPRSGTSLIEKIVGVNTEVALLGECNYFHHAVCEVSDDDDVMWGCQLIEGDQLKRVRSLYKQKYLVSNRLSKYVCDKSLENVFLVGQILQVFPEARIVWTRRDLRDVCLSCYASDFAGRHSYAHDLKILAKYAKTVEGLMTYWLKRFPDNLYVVDYEAFVDAPEAGIRALVQFLDFEWDDAYLAFHSASSRVKTLSYNDVQKPVYRRAVGQWQKYEEWLAPMLEELAGDPS